MKLYDIERSGNCYKIRLFLSMFKIDYEKVPVNPKAGDNKTDDFLALNPNGLVPVIVDGATAVYDSAAILCYLARKYGEGNWLPTDSLEFARVIRWLAFEQSEGRYGLARARAISLKNPSRLARSGTLEESQAIAQQALETLERQLSSTRWLAGGAQPTVCDIACYPYTAMSEEGGLSLEPYTAINKWLRNVEDLDGFIPLPGRA